MGVMVDSIVYDEAHLRVKLRQIVDRYQQPALVERFIDGREVTVGLVGNVAQGKAGKGLHIFPTMEVDMSRYPVEEGGIYSNRLKVELADDFHISVRRPCWLEQEAELKRLTAEVFRVTGCLDVAGLTLDLDAL